jgi:hypothetical protein
MASRSDTAAAANGPSVSVATTLSEASFVRLLARPDGDGLAAAGLLAGALRRVDVPFQVRVDSVGAGAPGAFGDDTDGLLVGVGSDRPDVGVTLAAESEPVSLRAYRIAAAMTDGADDAGPDRVLALAGAVADGAHPSSAAGDLVEAAEASGALVRRPGVAVPVDDVVDGLAHSTLLHAPFSGDRDATAATLSLSESDGAGTDDEARRTVASRVALAVAGDDDATPRAADAVERLLGPYRTPDAPVETLAGYADVLTAAARERPGTGVAVALGHGGTDAALGAWRDHGRAVHAALDSAPTTRHDGVVAVAVDDAGTPGRLATLARLVRDFRSPEPLVAAVGDGVVAVSTRESGAADAAATLAAEFPSGAAGWTGGSQRALAGVDADTPVPELVAAIRGRST